ncbi:hypothetical protein [Flavonifractor sp. An91]|uniref:hypothetical protein n=1 Tax=Flavonifractor sp. An91 TaxID=1965665 RepID=UPI000B39C213|nr:hypothetical protein [Flavonifractor sp. An91]OUN07733.1 hypothetical protein B5G42_14945 [Flavonifractor sp. An91]
MTGATCFFIGHRETGDELIPALTAAVERHITEYGVTSFMVGRYGNFDKLAARAVIDAKKRHPEVTLTLLLPYHPFDRPTPTPKGFDGTFYPPGMETVPKRVAIVRANRYMVEHSTHLIAYAWHPASNARALVEHARIWGRKGKIHIENLVK